MEYISVKQASEKWNMPERTVRNYCTMGKIEGAFLVGKTWSIPENASCPKKDNSGIIKSELIEILKREKDSGLKGGIYHKTQIELTYNSNHIEGTKLTEEQTRFIFETNTIGMENSSINVDDIIETINHFKCIDYIIDNALLDVSEKMVKKLHLILKSNTKDSTREWFNVGEYKKLPNEVGGNATCEPEKVKEKMSNLIKNYNQIPNKTIEDIIEFHKDFEQIHPFQDGNGRVGRLIMFKECLTNGIVPFIIDDDHKMFYYRGLKEWNYEKGYLIETCLSCQDKYKKWLDYFKINYNH